MPIVDFTMTAVPYQVHITLHPLTHCGLVTQSSDITSWILVNIGLGNGLLPDGTKPLTEPVLINHQWERLVFTWGQFHSNDIYLWHDLKIIHLRLQPPWANLRVLIAATGLVILPKLDLNRRFFSPCDLEIWWMTQKTIGHLFYATLSFLHHFVAIGEYKLELQSGNA